VTDKYDVPPRERIKVKEWHLTAKSPAGQKMDFVTVILVGRNGTRVDRPVKLEMVEMGKTVVADLEKERIGVAIIDDGTTPPRFAVDRPSLKGSVLTRPLIPARR
jgi:hypothetical protein